MQIPAGAVPSTVHVMAYGPDAMVDETGAPRDRIRQLRGTRPVLWVDVIGHGDAELLPWLAAEFGLHDLALEDVVNTHQRPKVETYSTHTFIVLRLPSGNGEEEGALEQISIFFGKGWVVTFQERSPDVFGGVRQRLRAGSPRIRSGGSDYLTYALLDTVVDSYFPRLEDVGERLETLEHQILIRSSTASLRRLHDTKSELHTLRRWAWPMREAVASLQRDESELIGPNTRLFLRDCHDHSVAVMDGVAGLQEIASSLVDLHMSSISNSMNEVMKVLTIIATIFIPLTFVAGIYGMNFDPEASPYNMPELRWAFGYPAAWLIMLVITLCLVWYFRRRGWIGSGEPKGE